MSPKINGLNIAVKDLKEATARYEKFFGMEGEHVGEDGFAFPGLEGTKFDIDGIILNLITSDVEGTSVSRFLEKEGEGVFLMSVKVDDIDTAVAQISGLGIPTMLEEPLHGGYGAVDFIHPKEMNGVQVELIENS